MHETPADTRFPPFPAPLFSAEGHPLFRWKVDPLASTHDERTTLGWIFGRMDIVMAWRAQVERRVRLILGLEAGTGGSGATAAAVRSPLPVASASSVGGISRSWKEEEGATFLDDHELGWNPDGDHTKRS